MSATRATRLMTAAQIVGGVGAALSGVAVLFYGFVILVGLGFAEQDGGASLGTQLALWGWFLGMLAGVGAGGLGTVWLHERAGRGVVLLAGGSGVALALALTLDLGVNGALTPVTPVVWAPYSLFAVAALMGRRIGRVA